MTRPGPIRTRMTSSPPPSLAPPLGSTRPDVARAAAAAPTANTTRRKTRMKTTRSTASSWAITWRSPTAGASTSPMWTTWSWRGTLRSARPVRSSSQRSSRTCPRRSSASCCAQPRCQTSSAPTARSSWYGSSRLSGSRARAPASPWPSSLPRRGSTARANAPRPKGHHRRRPPLRLRKGGRSVSGAATFNTRASIPMPRMKRRSRTSSTSRMRR
mmetsp:Transcript_10393/g.34404  ORF Transcript_10393/g.34404 Transcript_10393/m.34404 type:complete len:215 (-) Transcript_10393:3471-4115(-)